MTCVIKRWYHSCTISAPSWIMSCVPGHLLLFKDLWHYSIWCNRWNVNCGNSLISLAALLYLITFVDLSSSKDKAWIIWNWWNTEPSITLNLNSNAIIVHLSGKEVLAKWCKTKMTSTSYQWNKEIHEENMSWCICTGLYHETVVIYNVYSKHFKITYTSYSLLELLISVI